MEIDDGLIIKMIDFKTRIQVLKKVSINNDIEWIDNNGILQSVNDLPAIIDSDGTNY